MAEITIPAAPALLPPKEAKAWQRAYEEGYKRSQVDNNDAPDSVHRQTALREANRMLRVPEPKSYEEAMALPDWQVVKREVEGAALKLVTSDGRKYVFPAPKKAEKPPAA